ncbi:MAG TPA: CRISPR-associated protein Csx19 [Ktedonobacteraceae bacterium]|jgi:hypothetical protein
MAVTKTETRDFLHAGMVKDIAALIEACDFPPDAFFLGEQLPWKVIEASRRQELLQFAYVGELKRQNVPDAANNAGIDPAQYTSGRVFCSQFELRWHKKPQSDETQVVYLGEQDQTLPGLLPASDLAELRTELQTLERGASARYYLFGTTLDTSREGQRLLKQMGLPDEQKDGQARYYAEIRIPRLLRYPRLDSPGEKQRVRLVVCEYREKETGSVRLFRFQRIEAAE